MHTGLTEMGGLSQAAREPAPALDRAHRSADESLGLRQTLPLILPESKSLSGVTVLGKINKIELLLDQAF